MNPLEKILRINNLSLLEPTSKKQILSNIDLDIYKNTLNVIIGANGAGKSSLLNTIAGLNDELEVLGQINFNEENIENDSINKRSLKGLFISFQSPVEISGLKLLELIKKSSKKRFPQKTTPEVIAEIKHYIKKFNLPEEMLNWEVNSNLSGGQKKLSEALQMLMFKPELILIDEIDSGLDFDKIKIVANIINYLKENGATILLVSHHQAISDYLNVDQFILMQSGTVKMQGGEDILEKAKIVGYE